MERQRPAEREKEKADAQEVQKLQQELQRLRALKKQRELEKRREHEAQQQTEQIEQDLEYIPMEKDPEVIELDDIEAKLNQLDQFLTQKAESIDQQTYTDNTEYIEDQLQRLEEEIVGEKGLIQKELDPYEKLLEDYPWLEEKRYEFMYFIPDKKKNPNDYESWKTEWAKVMFDYARLAVLHILYFNKLYAQKPFSNFENRQEAVKEIAEELIDQDLAEWLSRWKKDSIRIYWKTLDNWANEIFGWAMENALIEPILLYEIREANQGFSNLPRDDLEEVFKILKKNGRGSIIKTDDGQIAIKIKPE